MTPDLVGPTAALAGAIAIVVALWREHLRADADDRLQRDQNYAGWRDQTDANARLAAAWEQRNRDEAARHRRTD